MKTILSGLLVCLSLSAFAQDNVLDLPRTLSMDFNKDGIKDTVSLTESRSDYHTLTITLSDKKTKKSKVVISNTGLIYAFSNPGAYLTKTSETSFKVGVDHSGIGRSAHITERAIAYRNGEFILSGYNLEFWDKISEKDSGSCDVNLLTGNAIRNGFTVKKERPVTPIQIAKLTDNYVPKTCQF